MNIMEYFIKHKKILLEISEKFGTPTYVYFEEILRENVQKYFDAFNNYKEFKLMYAYKANTNPEICKILKNLNVGTDAVSLGELYAAKSLGLNPENVIFTSNGKTDEGLEFALNFGCIINIDGFEEIEITDEIAKRLDKKPKISFRINPEVNPHTHDKIATGVKESKFGINIGQAIEAYKLAREKNFEILGIHCHIGSQITEIEPFIEETKKISKIAMDLHDIGINLKFVDLGGGLGIDYLHDGNYNGLTHNRLANGIIMFIENLNKNLGYEVELILEPGRSIVGNAGVLLTKVLSIKRTPYKKFINVDAGFNNLIRPAMYDAYHKILNLNDLSDGKEIFEIAGNLCESGDILGRNRRIAAKRNNVLAILDTGAYGFSMSSNYNSMQKPVEILIEKDKKVKVLREREKFSALIK
ncbi:Diaminopimelate decarboxylase [groundwater metagenome]|uniref:Diaminopimelate decarboxylase n=1 Tax=groundwater metagenome TaxID=717931 RepID=A0A098E9Z8_9ZZZZ